MTSWLISPSERTGNNRRIELAGIDLWILACTDKIFVYPSSFNIDQFKKALSRTLSMWPLVSGRFLLIGDDQYVIEMSDNAISIVYDENNESDICFADWNIVTELKENLLAPFVDQVKLVKLIRGSNEEPLVRFKITRLTQNEELVLGISWAHILGDAAAFLNFLKTLSRLYQNLEPVEPFPVFERRLWRKNEINQSFLPIMKHLRDAGPLMEMFEKFSKWQETYEQINLRFSGKQLSKLREIGGVKCVTIQDCLSAYLILTLNIHCYQNDEHRRILRANTVVNFRSVSDSIAPVGHVSNSILMILSDDFNNPLSLTSIAKTIRQSIERSRDRQFLECWVSTADGLMRKMAHENLLANWSPYPNEVVINSNLRYDWVRDVDFGFIDKCRLYTVWTAPLYFRVFRQNPVRDGMHWQQRDRDRDGAEVAFAIEKEFKQCFLNAWEKDVADDFASLTPNC